jgi:alkanesulfonate monooxygenase SsuD/methylene tetrahydromethanopterin reductase-like flavin-dependent oxidoreductase (luciferase family)
LKAPATSRLHLGVFPWRLAPADLRVDPRSSVPAQARRAESLGYDSFWLPESHFVAQARPAPLLELAAAAAVTRRVQLGVTSYLLPIRHPLLVAEEVAVLDRLSRGRLILGLGRGFRAELFSAFGVSRTEKREIFEEALGTMLRAWRGEPVGGATAADGVATAAPEGSIELFPRPLQQPHPPLWVAAFGPKALRQAARLGLPYLASPLEPFARLRENIELHRELLRAGAPGHPTANGAARPVDELPVPVLRTVFVSRSRSKVEAARRALEPELARWRRVLGELDASRSGNGAENTTLEQHALVGDPDSVAAEIERHCRELGMTHLVVRSPPGIGLGALEASLRELPGLVDRGGSAPRR